MRCPNNPRRSATSDACLALGSVHRRPFISINTPLSNTSFACSALQMPCSLRVPMPSDRTWDDGGIAVPSYYYVDLPLVSIYR